MVDVFGSLPVSDTILNLLPVFFAVMAVGCLTPKTRSLCYITVLLAILTELIPLASGINIVALLACTFCLGALLVADLVQSGKSIALPIRSQVDL